MKLPDTDKIKFDIFSGNIKRLINIVSISIIAIFFIKSVDIQQFSLLLSFKHTVIVLSASMTFAIIFLRFLRWCVFRLEIPKVNLFEIISVGLMLGRMTPVLVGELSIPIRFEGSKKYIFKLFVYEKVIDLSVILMLILAGFVFVYGNMLASAGIILLLIICIKLWNFYLKDLKITDFLLFFIITVLLWLITSLQLYIISREVIPTQFWALTLSLMLSYIFGAASMLPGGLGAREASFAYLLDSYFGIGVETGLVISMVYRATLIIPIFLVGSFMYVFIKRREGQV
jgi:hypothetical protein